MSLVNRALKRSVGVTTIAGVVAVAPLAVTERKLRARGIANPQTVVNKANPNRRLGRFNRIICE